MRIVKLLLWLHLKFQDKWVSIIIYIIIIINFSKELLKSIFVPKSFFISIACYWNISGFMSTLIVNGQLLACIYIFCSKDPENISWIFQSECRDVQSLYFSIQRDRMSLLHQRVFVTSTKRWKKRNLFVYSTFPQLDLF